MADALDTYAAEAAPLAKRLAELQEDAKAFAASVEGDDDWTEDEDKVRRNEELINEVTAIHLAFQEAERRAANKISALVGGPQFVADHGSGFYRRNTVTYGVDKKLLEGAENLPWGSVDEQNYEAWSAGWFGHGIKSALWDGVYKDGIEAGVVGLWTLAGGNGAEASSEAWGGLLDVVQGIGLYTVKPYDALMDSVFGPDKESAEEIKAKKAAKEFGKGFLAWDQWEENPARAAGTVSFNLLTLGAGPLMKAGMAGEAGALARGAGALGKVGLYIDPIAATAMATGKAVGKIPTLSELTARLTAGSAAAADAQRLHSVIELDDGSRVVVENGEFIAYDKHGQVVNSSAPPERPRTESSAADVTAHARDRELATVGGGARAGEPTVGGSGGGGTAAGHVAGDGARSNGGHGDSSGGGAALGGADGAGGMAEKVAAAQREAMRRPEFMRDGPNPYGPRGSLTREQIEQIQVYRANHDPDYLSRHYRRDGTRKNLSVYDESGFTPPQLTRFSDDAPWIRAKDVPEPPQPHYLGDSQKLSADSVSDARRRQILEESAERRHAAIQRDNQMADWKAEADRNHRAQGTPESAAGLEEATKAYKDSHRQMIGAAEEFGGNAARHHFIAEHYPGFTDEPLLGPKNGNDQFDQVWTHEDGRVVVVEAKSSVETDLGRRTLPDGTQVSQGSREYFDDIMEQMRHRGEWDLVSRMEDALDAGKLEYVLVKGEKNAGAYNGLRYRRFDISKGTLW
ncbi:hypothetical protein [Streptomyces sp. DH24]|uniref:hypothetical protein n=1 Tax=Streptomyces sp. DH24 TaxID=3040123 RepID=UPI002441733B|nr:hypothetical protein [Streptomyces sp. DH24]MDG9718721.1 hypothetical protein [Streptomyces sp. DH24]